MEARLPCQGGIKRERRGQDAHETEISWQRENLYKDAAR